MVHYNDSRGYRLPPQRRPDLERLDKPAKYSFIVKVEKKRVRTKARQYNIVTAHKWNEYLFFYQLQKIHSTDSFD